MSTMSTPSWKTGVPRRGRFDCGEMEAREILITVNGKQVQALTEILVCGLRQEVWSGGTLHAAFMNTRRQSTRDQWAKDELLQLLEVLEALGVEPPSEDARITALLRFNVSCGKLVAA